METFVKILQCVGQFLADQSEVIRKMAEKIAALFLFPL